MNITEINTILMEMVSQNKLMHLLEKANTKFKCSNRIELFDLTSVSQNNPFASIKQFSRVKFPLTNNLSVENRKIIKYLHLKFRKYLFRIYPT